jgi:hypothetical protein
VKSLDHPRGRLGFAVILIALQNVPGRFRQMARHGHHSLVVTIGLIVFHSSIEPHHVPCRQDRVLEGMENIGDKSAWLQEGDREARRCLVSRFPYGLWYRVQAHGSIIIACLRAKRSLELAKGRAKGPAPV